MRETKNFLNENGVQNVGGKENHINFYAGGPRNNKVEILEEKIKSLERELAGKDKEIQSLNETIKAKNDLIEVLKDRG